MEAEYITVTEAQQRLGVSRDKISRLMRDGELPYTINPLDRRKKFVLVTDLEALKKRQEQPKSRKPISLTQE
jgi:predicted site-specific integrase-resolvase